MFSFYHIPVKLISYLLVQEIFSCKGIHSPPTSLSQLADHPHWSQLFYPSLSCIKVNRSVTKQFRVESSLDWEGHHWVFTYALTSSSHSIQDRSTAVAIIETILHKLSKHCNSPTEKITVFRHYFYNIKKGDFACFISGIVTKSHPFCVYTWNLPFSKIIFLVWRPKLPFFGKRETFFRSGGFE